MDTDRPELPYPYLVVEGNIGAGKTTLCRRLADTYRCDLLLERFDDNPFLPLFYEDQERYALMVELFFMAERHGQMAPHLTAPSLFAEPILSDYVFLKTWLFARQTLRAHELELFRKLFDQLNTQLPLPQKLVFIHRPVKVLLELIAKRGRAYEASISADYLGRVQQTYYSYFREEKRFPIVVVNVGDADFERDDAVYQQMEQLIVDEHSPGMTVVGLGYGD